ncbi:type II toxin-antitoxin system RelE family toxin [Anaerophaga thermohalophila]|uniref:type II toxin-antitoxin system RelE family toxin n=1 Tax=Anaerophaga thermohalophila TaxID=177400 RepID=UPI000237D411|nr:type II toxin-antitoxin system RelE/ParE family toxin [Anaerophaga thermohalophila]
MGISLKYNKTFLKELAKVPPRQRMRIEKIVFVDIQHIERLDEIPGLKKLTGFDNYFRIRFGDYRAGIRIEENQLIFERLLHRKDIYKYFP